jgi:hypothetical protein
LSESATLDPPSLHLLQRNRLAALVRRMVNWIDEQDCDFGDLLDQADELLASFVEAEDPVVVK